MLQTRSICFRSWLFLSGNKTPLEQSEQSLSGVQTKMLVRIAISVLHETWGPTRERFLGTGWLNEFFSNLAG